MISKLLLHPSSLRLVCICTPGRQHASMRCSATERQPQLHALLQQIHPGCRCTLVWYDRSSADDIVHRLKLVRGSFKDSPAGLSAGFLCCSLLDKSAPYLEIQAAC